MDAHVAVAAEAERLGLDLPDKHQIQRLVVIKMKI